MEKFLYAFMKLSSWFLSLFISWYRGSENYSELYLFWWLVLMTARELNPLHYPSYFRHAFLRMRRGYKGR